MNEEFAIATSLEDITTNIRVAYLAVRGVSFPFTPPYQSSSKVIGLANGHVREIGVGIAEWQWAFISMDERDILRAILPNPSNNIYIRTLNEEKEWTSMYGIGYWPTKGEDFRVDSSLGFSLTFKIFEVLA